MTKIELDSNLARYGIAGALTTAVSIPIVHPFYTICTYLVSKENLRKTLMPENRLAYRVLYRGMVSNGFCDLSGQIAAFCAFGYGKKYALGEVPSALSAGCAAAPVFNAWDRIMTIQQLCGKSIRETVRLIQTKEGHRGVFKGSSWTMLQECLYQTFFFSTSNRLAEKLSSKHEWNPTVSKVVCYGSTGFAIGAITSPVQYIRTLVHKELGKEKAIHILSKLSAKTEIRGIVQLAKLRTPLIGVNMVVAGLAKDFFLSL